MSNTIKSGYFIGCETLEEVRKHFKTLVLKHHPDRGGSEQEMKQINSDYLRASKIIAGTVTDEEEKANFEADEKFSTIIQSLINLPNISIEIVGSWLWVSGNTFAVKDTLKSAGLLFASGKKMWFWRSESDKVQTFGKTLEIEEIRAKYGSNKIFTSFKNQLA